MSDEWCKVHANWPASGEANKAKGELIAEFESAGIATDPGCTTVLKTVIRGMGAVAVGRSDRAAEKDSGKDEAFHSLAKWDLQVNQLD